MDLSDRARLFSPTFNRLMPDEREEYVEAMLHAHDDVLALAITIQQTVLDKPFIAPIYLRMAVALSRDTYKRSALYDALGKFNDA